MACVARSACVIGWLSLATLGACATGPRGPVERALYGDLAKAVELSDNTGWVIDRVQLENNAEAALRSVCQVAPEKRQALERWLDAQVAEAGGPAADIYRRNGRDLDAVSDVLELERVRALLRYAHERAGADCPFWLEPDPSFLGVQSDHGRLVLFAETIGYGSLLVDGDDSALGGGGGGRLLAGYGVAPQLTLALGVEAGGSGAFRNNEMGSRSLATTFSAAVPVLARVSSQSRVYDFEVAPVVRFNPGVDAFPPGVRSLVGIGFTTMRAAALMPYALLWLGYEYHPADEQSPADHAVHVGTRVGIDWDP